MTFVGSLAITFRIYPVDGIVRVMAWVAREIDPVDSVVPFFPSDLSPFFLLSLDLSQSLL